MIFPISIKKRKALTNVTTIQNIIRWLKADRVLISYPGGGASALSEQVRRGGKDWSSLPILLAQKTGAVILPVKLKLAEPQWQLFLKKYCHPLYEVLTFHILNSFKNTKAQVDIGAPIRYEDLPFEMSKEQQAQWLKERTASL